MIHNYNSSYFILNGDVLADDVLDDDVLDDDMGGWG